MRAVKTDLHESKTGVKPTPASPPESFPHQTRQFMALWAPVLSLLVFTALLALAAWALGWYRAETLVAGAGAGVFVMAIAAILLYRQARHGQAANRARRGVEARVS